MIDHGKPEPWNRGFKLNSIECDESVNNDPSRISLKEYGLYSRERQLVYRTSAFFECRDLSALTVLLILSHLKRAGNIDCETALRNVGGTWKY